MPKKSKKKSAPVDAAALQTAMTENQVPPPEIGNETDPQAPEKRKRRGRKQPELPAMEGPGVEPVVIPEIEECATAYVELRDARMGMLRNEIKGKEALLELMKTHELWSYDFDGYTVLRTKPGEEDVKVKKKTSYKEGTMEEPEDVNVD